MRIDLSLLDGLRSVGHSDIRIRWAIEQAAAVTARRSLPCRPSCTANLDLETGWLTVIAGGTVLSDPRMVDLRDLGRQAANTFRGVLHDMLSGELRSARPGMRVSGVVESVSEDAAVVLTRSGCVGVPLAWFPQAPCPGVEVRRVRVSDFQELRSA